MAVPRFVRAYINLQLHLLDYYSAHQVVVDAALVSTAGAQVVAALHTLLAAYQTIKAVNPPGPN